MAKSDDLTPNQIAIFARQFRRRAAEAVAKAKTLTDPAEKVLTTRDATSYDALAGHFERVLAETMTKA